jgi:UDP-N-acetylglucosamine:LPS N-acetylglucosamine transferase
MIAEDLIDEGRNAAGAGQVILELIRDGGRRERMRAALRRLGPADGAARIAGMLLADR